MASAVEDVRRVRPERLPPQNLEAEESVLGSMMLSSEAIAEVIEELKPEDFYKSSHRRIYEALLHLYGRGEPVDAITAVEELKRRNILEDIGGPLVVHELVEITEPGGDAAVCGFPLMDVLELLHRLIDQSSDRNDLVLVVAAGCCVDELLRLIGGRAGILGVRVGELHDLRGGVDHPSE